MTITGEDIFVDRIVVAYEPLEDRGRNLRGARVIAVTGNALHFMLPSKPGIGTDIQFLLNEEETADFHALQRKIAARLRQESNNTADDLPVM